MSKRMIQGKKEKSAKQVVIEGNEAEVKETEVVQQTFLGTVWSWVMFFMWLPLAIPIRFTKFWFDIAVKIIKTLLPYLVSVWKFICETTPKLASPAEKIPVVGSSLAWVLNLPPRFNLKEFLQLILSFVKKRPDPEVVDVNQDQAKKT